jgi:hypothetical protein
MQKIYYAYKGQKEPTGTKNRYIFRDLKTNSGAIRRAKKLMGDDVSVFVTDISFNNSIKIN